MPNRCSATPWCCLVVTALAVHGHCLASSRSHPFRSRRQPGGLPYARDYLRIIVLGSIFQMVGFGVNAMIRGEGNPRVAMFSMLISVLVNLILAPLFIFVFQWGMKGAALATVIAQAVTTVWVVSHFLGRASHLQLRARNLWPDRAVCARILAMGSPQFTMQLAASALQAVLNHQLLVYGDGTVYGGDMAISVLGIIWSVMMMVAMPIFGINQGAQPIIGYNYGAERFDRVKKALETAILGATGLTLFGFTAAMVFPGDVVRLFVKYDDANLAEIIALGTHAIRITLLTLPIIGFQIVSASYFQAVGKPRVAMFLMLSRQVLLLIPAVLILPHFFGLDGVWAAIPTADVVSSVLTAFCLSAELRHLRVKHASYNCAG